MFEIAPEEFDLEFFRQEGLERHQCPKCKSYFWARPGRDTCGETPCAPYTFIDNPPTRRPYSMEDMRRQFLDYFATNSHTVIKPYPVVARWRNDVYLVGASIMDFQPYVIEGTMPPPANPLVVSQPVMRFTDIEKVGVPTAGRHMTIFEMGGHHAFNSPDREVYWKEETVRYHHKLLVDVLGVPAEQISYKEHFWSGGGNAGPDLEGIVSGLEISTLVFMRYKVEGDQLVPMKIRTVDTGYGIERWAWLSQGSPSGFHATYGPLLEKVFAFAGLVPDQTLMKELSVASGIHDVSSRHGWDSMVKWVAEKTGREFETTRDDVSKLHAAYVVTDHTKAAAFLLAEGVVPSNVGEGYLARLIIRRAARLARQLGLEDSLDQVMEAQVKHWSPDFPKLREMRSEILEALDVETKKYKETVVKGYEAVQRLSKELASKGERKVSVEKLVELYDSQGLSPEIVKEAAAKTGVEVDVPDNFLSLVAERHAKPATKMKEKQEEELANKVKGLPPTRTLYYDDPYQTEFKAKVVGRVGEKAVVLDQTCFYPEGGGQLADHGLLKAGDKTVKVENVQKWDNVIVHFLDQPLPNGSETLEVIGEVNWPRRQRLMRHHTSTHVLLGAARRVLGEHVWQAGAQKDVEHSRLDITHYKEVTPKELDKIEGLVNQTILRNLPVQATWMSRDKAEAKYGYRLYQGGPVPGPKLRVVTIDGWDAEACGGTHCKRTGELGIFRIEKLERLQDGVERIIFTAGEPALESMRRDSSKLVETSQILGVPPEKVPETVRLLLKERDEYEHELRKYRAKETKQRTARLAKKAVQTGPVKVVIAKLAKRTDTDPVDIANRLKEASPEMVAILFEASKQVKIVGAAGDAAVKAGVNAGQIVSEAARVLGGGGGGRPFFATGGGPDKKKLEEAIERARDAIKRQVEQSARAGTVEASAN